MRVVTAGSRSFQVDEAEIVFQDERAGHSVKNRISLFINLQICRCKITRLHPQETGKPCYISFSQERTCRPTAVAAFETINFIKYIFMDLP